MALGQEIRYWRRDLHKAPVLRLDNDYDRLVATTADIGQNLYLLS
jgi:hypothetical protein